MAMYPDVQRKAQEELDRVVGTERLPTFEDRSELPYVNAIVKECLRYVACFTSGLNLELDVADGASRWNTSVPLSKTIDCLGTQ